MKTFWRCTVCGWKSRIDTENPPELCPLCGATDPDDFERI